MSMTLRSRLSNALVLLTSPRYHWIVTPLVVFVTTRGFIYLAGYIGRLAFMGLLGSVPWQSHPNNIPLDIWDRWDSSYHRAIARDGYVYNGPEEVSNVPFFPMYALLMRIVNLIVPDLTLAGMLVSNICFLGALIFLYQLTRLETDSHLTSQRSLFYIALFPTAFIFMAVYTESVFLLFSVACFYFARKRLWLWSGVMGALATATRFAGIFLYAAVLLDWLYAQDWTLRTFFSRDAWKKKRILQMDWLGFLAVNLIPLGLLGYMLFLEMRFGDALAFQKALGWWGQQQINNPISTIWHEISALLRSNPMTGQGVMWREAFEAIAALLALIISPFVWRKFGISFAAYTILAVLVPAGTGSTRSLLRYVNVLFPLFMMLGFWGRNATFDKFITIGFTILLGIFAAVFVNWGFVT